MKKFMTGCGAIVITGFVITLLVVLSVGGWLIGAYNGLQRQDEAVTSSWAEVETQYQRRIDLIPNLVQVVKGYAEHEEGVFTGVAEARASVGQVKLDVQNLQQAGQEIPAEKLTEYANAQQSLGSAISRLLLVQERYPELKADQQFLNLQHELAGTENRIAVARGRFNDTAQKLNTDIRVFPKSFIADFAGIGPRAYFEAQQGAETAPQVSFEKAE